LWMKEKGISKKDFEEEYGKWQLKQQIKL
jgi:hypothetical protein